MKRNKMVLIGFLFLLSFAFASSAYAIPFTGDAWIAQHYENGIATDEYYLVVSVPNISNVKVHGFAFLDSGQERDFSGLTGQAGNEGISWLQVDNANSSAGLALSEYMLYFKDVDTSTWYQPVNGSPNIGFATFENPQEVIVVDNDPPPGGGAAPVPEPTTLFLLGTGLVGVAAFRRRFK